jgi:cyclopropane-fatty-acyl-phospholipid synthase
MKCKANVAKHQEAETSLGASPEAIRYHYDVGNAFFRLWLDSSMTYSAGMWTAETESLESAQSQKRLFHIKASRAEGQQRVLDIGCGWGSLLADLVNIHGVETALGLTLSPAQREWIAKLNIPGVEARLEGWQNHVPLAPYDAIISVGAFEHFVRPDYDSNQRRHTYRHFFKKCHEILRPGGWMSLQTQTYLLGEYSPRSPLSAVFPESDMPRLSEILEACDRLFELESMHNRPADYLATLRCWLQRFSENEGAIVALTNEDVSRQYIRFLSGGVKGYSNNIFMLLRMSLRRV